MLLFMFEYDKYDEANYWYTTQGIHQHLLNIRQCSSTAFMKLIREQ